MMNADASALDYSGPSTAESVDVLGASVQSFRHRPSGAVVVAASKPGWNPVLGLSVKTPPDGDSGAAHVLEHCVLHAEAESGGSVMDLVRSGWATRVNGITSQCHTSFFAECVQTEDIPHIAGQLLRGALDAPITPKLFRQEAGGQGTMRGANGVVLNEMNAAFAKPRKQILSAIRRAMFGGSPFAWEPGGTPAGLRELRLEDVTEFRRRHYRLDGAVLFVAGEGDLSSVVTRIEALLGERAGGVRQLAPISCGEAATVAVDGRYAGAPDSPHYRWVTWNLGGRLNDEHQIAWEVLQRVLFVERRRELMGALRERGIDADPHYLGLQRVGPHLLLHVGLQSSRPSPEFGTAAVLNALMHCSREIDSERLRAAARLYLMELREAAQRPLEMLRWVAIAWTHAGDPLSGLDPRAPIASFVRRCDEQSNVAEAIAADLSRCASATTTWSPKRRLRDEAQTPLVNGHVMSNPGSSKRAGATPVARPLEQLPETPVEPEILVDTVNGIDLIASSARSDDAIYLALHVDLTHVDGIDPQQLGLFGMTVGRFAVGKGNRVDVVRQRMQHFLALELVPYSASHRGEVSLGVRMFIRCHVAQAESVLAVLRELIFLPTTEDHGAAAMALKNLVEQQRRLSRANLFARTVFGALCVSSAASWKYYWSGEGLIEVARNAAREGSLFERIERVRGAMRQGTWYVSAAAPGPFLEELRGELRSWALQPTSGWTTPMSPPGVFGERRAVVVHGLRDCVHAAAAMPMPSEADPAYTALTLALQHLNDHHVVNHLRTNAMAYGAACAVDTSHAAALLFCNTASATEPFFDALQNMSQWLGTASEQEFRHTIRRCAAPYLMKLSPQEVVAAALDRRVRRDDIGARTARYQRVINADLVDVVEQGQRWLDARRSFPSLSLMCPSEHVSGVWDRMGDRRITKTHLREHESRITS